MFASKTYSKVSNSWGYGWWRRETGGYDPYIVSRIIYQQTKTDIMGVIIEEHLTPSFCFQDNIADEQIVIRKTWNMQGLGRNLAYSLAAQTMVGAGRMVLETGEVVLYFMYE